MAINIDILSGVMEYLMCKVDIGNIILMAVLVALHDDIRKILTPSRLQDTSPYLVCDDVSDF